MLPLNHIGFEIGSVPLVASLRCTFTKAYEYTPGPDLQDVKKMYSVAYVIRPRTSESNACLCFTAVVQDSISQTMEERPDMCDPSRTVILDLEAASEWQMDSIVEPVFWEPVKSLDDDKQVQCLPVFKAQQLVYQLCAENITKGALVPMTPEAERHLLLTGGCSHPSQLCEEEGVLCVQSRAAHRRWFHVVCATIGVMHHVATKPTWVGFVLAMSEAQGGRS